MRPPKAGTPLPLGGGAVTPGEVEGTTPPSLEAVPLDPAGPRVAPVRDGGEPFSKLIRRTPWPADFQVEETMKLLQAVRRLLCHRISWT